MRTLPFTVFAVLASMLLVGSTSLSVGRSAGSAAGEAADYVTVTPDNQSSGSVTANTSGHQASFTVTFVGNEMDDDETFDLWCTTTLEMGCSVSTPVTLTPNMPQGVNVSFSTTSQTGTGYVYLHALGWTTSFYDTGSRYYQMGPAVEVTAVSVPSTVVQHSKGEKAIFDVTNHTSTGGTFTITCEWGGPWCTGSHQKWIGATSTTRDTLWFDAGAVAATHTLKLTAVNGEISGSKSENVGVSEFLSVNAVAQDRDVYAVPNVERTDEFMVRFPGQSPSSFAMTVWCPEEGTKAHRCSVHSVDDTMSVGDTPAAVRVIYTAGANGDTSTVRLTATKVGTEWIAQAGDLEVARRAASC
jgi:hypothetical protein